MLKLIHWPTEGGQFQAIIAGMRRLQGARRKATRIALEEDLLKELKEAAHLRGVPYQVLMRLLIADGLKRIKAA